jgi:hypothetical protein
MTAMRDRVSAEEDTGAPFELELPVQLDDDDYFEPTIVRGRE